MKVWAGLTWGVETGEEGEPDSPAHQVSRYLTVAASSPEIEAFVVVLAPYAVDLGFDNGHREGYGGQVSWQNIHDVFARAVATGALNDDRTMTTLAQNFYQLLETKKMAAPKLTFDLLTSVSRYWQFEAWGRVILTQARDALVGADDELRTFYKGNSSAWQNGDYDRLGWRVWVDSKDVNAFAFIGIHVGQDTIHEEVPDLYVVQARRGGDSVRTSL